MNISTIIVITIIVALTAWAVRYIVRAHKSGNHCIGCSQGSCCSDCKECSRRDLARPEDEKKDSAGQ